MTWERVGIRRTKRQTHNTGKKEIVGIRLRVGQVLQREQRADRNLRGAEHCESILRKEKWRVNTMEKAKENAALSGKRSSGVAPCQGQKNREAVNGDSLLRMTATGKIEETNLDLLREYRMNVFAQKSTSSLLIRSDRISHS